MAIKSIIETNAEIVGIEISPELIQKLEIYAKELKEWNEKINLTAIKDDEGIAIKHFIDSLMLLKYVEIPENSKIIDVGTGAGFPGLVIAAARSDVKVTLLDSTGKKLKVVADIAEKMGLSNYEILNMRAEEAGQKKEFREQYDFATARAVAPLNILLELLVPFVKVNGSILALKGSSYQDELDVCNNAFRQLDINIEHIYHETLPKDLGSRPIIVINKNKKTNIKYPRAYAQIKKKPL